MVNKNILIIDDEQGSLDVMCKVVEDDGFEIHCATSVEEAIEMFNAAEPFLVLTDLWLRAAGIDGATLADRLHRKDPFCIFVAVSGYVSAFDLGYLLGAVFTDVLQKPFELEDLVKVVRYAWEKRQRWENILWE